MAGGPIKHLPRTNKSLIMFFKLKKLKNYMRYHVGFLLPYKLQKISCYFGLNDAKYS